MTGVLDGAPAWATTGVGSLPHERAEDAVRHVLAAYDVPFLPQLPQLDGDMIAEWLGDDPRRCGWSPDRDREIPRAWSALLAELARTPPVHGIVKLQVTGPATLAYALERERGAGGPRAQALELAREIAAWLAANVAGRVRDLDALELRCLVVVDEPGLHLFGAGDIDAAWDPLRAVSPAWGLHLCGPVPWAAVARARPDLLSVDLAAADVLGEGRQALDGLLAAGSRVALGVVQPHRAESVHHALRRVLPVAEALGLDGRQVLLTASCGTGRVSRDREAQIAAVLRATAGRMHGGVTPEAAWRDTAVTLVRGAGT